MILIITSINNYTVIKIEERIIINHHSFSSSISINLKWKKKTIKCNEKEKLIM